MDAVIALGYPTLADGCPSPVMMERVKAAVEAYRHYGAKAIIFTGGAVRNRFSEAAAMYEYAKTLAVPEHALIREEQARTTYENAYYSVKLMAHRGWKSAVIVTSPYHMLRSRIVFSNYPITFQMYEANHPPGLKRRQIFRRLLEYVYIADFLVRKRKYMEKG